MLIDEIEEAPVIDEIRKIECRYWTRQDAVTPQYVVEPFSPQSAAPQMQDDIAFLLNIVLGMLYWDEKTGDLRV